jgi:hypothetical protein
VVLESLKGEELSKLAPSSGEAAAAAPSKPALDLTREQAAAMPYLHRLKSAMTREEAAT